MFTFQRQRKRSAVVVLLSTALMRVWYPNLRFILPFLYTILYRPLAQAAMYFNFMTGLGGAGGGLHIPIGKIQLFETNWVKNVHRTKQKKLVLFFTLSIILLILLYNLINSNSTNMGLLFCWNQLIHSPNTMNFRNLSWIQCNNELCTCSGYSTFHLPWSICMI